MIRHKLFFATSFVAMAAAAPALGQEQNSETVVVSASRIAVGGYTAPTPVTVVSAEKLQRDAKADIGDAIRELPALGTSIGSNTASNGSQNSGGQGQSFLNLRQLGVTRTLVLFNGQRVVNSNVNGGVDLQTMPSSLVQRVDIVTGGASAAWGSDAVAGVVNIILNKSFTGFAANLQGSETQFGDVRALKAEGSFGTDFDGGRGHFIVSGGYTISPDFITQSLRPNIPYNVRLFPNPAYVAGNGQPRLIHVSNTGQSQATRGGLIMGCGTIAAPTTSVNCPLKYTQFIGPDAMPTTFIPGLVNGAFATGSSAEAATWTTASGPGLNFTAPYHSFTFFSHGRYNLADDLSASLELEYGRDLNKSASTQYQKLGNQIIMNDNPYIPAATLARMNALGYKSIFVGTNNLNGDGRVSMSKDRVNMSTSIDDLYGILGPSVYSADHTLYRGVFSLDGSLGDWTWNAYLQHGHSRGKQKGLHDVNTASYTRAVDAVTVTTANVGTSGLQLGSVACRSTLTAPTNGCVPLNIFGEHNISAAAMNYIANPDVYGGQYTNQRLTEDVISASMQGQLPAEWSLPAGRIAVAFGAEARLEGFNQGPTDPTSLATGWNAGNFGSFLGHYSVEEGFGEITVPILKDSFVQDLEFNTSGRITSYSTSGLVETWKLGVTSQLTDDIKVRSTWSFDIRAPNLFELFSTGTCGSSQQLNPFNGNTELAFTCSGGNANLVPEQSTTVSGGVVLTPTFLGLDGLSLSADWYSITIKKAITSISATTIETQCQKGQQLYCAQISFQNGVMFVATSPINANVETVSGLDFQGDYNFSFMNGSVDLHAVGNYTDEQTRLAQGTYSSYAGQLSTSDGTPVATGLPKFKGQLSATYDAGNWNATVQGRFIGSARLVRAWTPLDVDDNSIPMVAYLDLRGQYKLNDNITLYGAIDNLTHVPPQAVPGTTESRSAGTGQIYDVLGRMFRAGIRLRY